MSAAPTLTGNFYWLIAGNVIRAGCQWGMLSVLAKQGSPRLVGQYALGLAITAPLMMMAGLQLNALQVTDARGEYDLADYLGIKILGAVIALFVVTGLLFVIRFPTDTAAVILLVALSKALDALSDVFLSHWQQREQMRLVSAMWIVNATSSLILLTIGLAINGTAISAATGSLVGSAIALGAIWMVAKNASIAECREISPRFDRRILRSLIRVAIPMGGVGALLSLNLNIPRYYVEHYIGDLALGLFAAAAYPMVVADTLISSIGQSTSSRLAQYYAANNKKAFQELLLRLTLWGVAVGCSAVLAALYAGRQILTILYRPEYGDHERLFALLVIAVAIRYTYVFIGVAVTAMRRFTIQLWLRIAVCLCLLALSPVLISRFGLLGAATALIIVSALEGTAWVAIGYAYIGGRSFWPPRTSLEPVVAPLPA
jgi:O-antigen/teichoic acid export membrane protein